MVSYDAMKERAETLEPSSPEQAGGYRMMPHNLEAEQGLLGALLVAVLPLYSVLAVDLGTAVLAVLPLLFIFIPQQRLFQFYMAFNKDSLWITINQSLY